MSTIIWEDLIASRDEDLPGNYIPSKWNLLVSQRNGNIDGARVIGGAVASATQFSIPFSSCVEITALTGVTVTVNGVPQTPLASVKITDQTWAFQITPIARGDTLVWSYDGTGGITDCRTGRDIGEQEITLSTVAEPVPDDGGSGWVRPADWPVLWSPAPGTEAVVGLFAVNNTADERVAMTMADAYTVDWGDGTKENFAAGTKAEHNYVYANLTSPVTAAGYKTAIIRVTPQAGQNLTSVDITTPHTGAVPASTKWLDIELRCPFATIFMVGSNIVGSANALKPLVQRILVREHNATNMQNNFRGCAALRSVPLFDTQNATTMANMFLGDTALTTVPLFNTSQVTTTRQMFMDAAALVNVPLFDTQKVTTMESMFARATSMVNMPLFNTLNVTTMQNMFNGAAALTTVPLLNTQNVRNMVNMFSNAAALTAVPALNMQSVITVSPSFVLNTKVASLLASGMRVGWGVNNALLSATALNTVFTNLGTASGTQVITIIGNPGAATCNRTIATAKGWTVTG